MTGVDLSPGMLDKARKRHLYDRLIEEEALAYLSQRDETYDLIAALDVLVYFGNLTELFAAAAGCLDPGGVFEFSYETGDCDSYELQPSARFAHAAAYVDSLYWRDFVLIASLATTLRLEANQPVGGRMVLPRLV